jgi:hypothetical protein
VDRTPTAPVAAGTLIAGYAVAAGSGSRPLGGVLLLIGGAWCMRAWLRRDGPRRAAVLGGAGVAAFVCSHLLALAIGGWLSVLLLSAAMAAAAWLLSDAPRPVGRYAGG